MEIAPRSMASQSPPDTAIWQLIAVNQLLFAGKGEQLRAQFGNYIVIKAFKAGTLPFPDGAMIAAIHWTRVPSEDNNKVLNGPFPGTQSFIIGSLVNLQFMIKDSKKYAATGGWEFADCKDGNVPQSKLDSRLLRGHFRFLSDADDFFFATTVCLLPFLPLFFWVPGACRCWAADFRVLG
jgi:Cytochrome P460